MACIRIRREDVKPSRRQMIRMVLSQAGLAASGVGLLLSATLVTGPPQAQAESDALPAETLLRVANTGGYPINLLAGPSIDQPTVVQLAPDEKVTLIGAGLVVGETRWLPVRTSRYQIGWISDQYVVAVGPAPNAAPVAQAPIAEPSPSPEPVLTELPITTAEAPTVTDTTPPVEAVAPVPVEAVAPVALASPEPLTVSGQTTGQSANQTAAVVEPPRDAGKPLEVEAKVKFPEAKGRHQEVTIWVTRNGTPVPDAIVVIFTEDDEDEPLRELQPTNAEGRTWREFAIGKQKGSIELVVSALAPDGGKGRTTVSYFRR
jgi:hypothetical protein